MGWKTLVLAGSLFFCCQPDSKQITESDQQQIGKDVPPFSEVKSAELDTKESVTPPTEDLGENLQTTPPKMAQIKSDETPGADSEAVHREHPPQTNQKPPENPREEEPQLPLPDHTGWDKLLQKYVSASGEVNYRALARDRQLLEQYLSYLEAHPIDPSWDDNVKLAYWINAYNAFTVELILRHYPLKSIRDLDKPWDQKFITLGDQKYSLNQIEHEIIRPTFGDPRIHFALVCAAVSCPKLLNRAYQAHSLDRQLDSQTSYFLNSSGKNKLRPDKVEISQLFNWYGEDFTKDGTLIEFLNRYSKLRIAQDAEVIFTEYDWALNE